MQKKQSKALVGKNTDTVIGEGVIFENAIIKGGGVIRIDGQFIGTIDIKGHIILGETGVLSGDIVADSALIAGKYQGDLCIRNTLHLTGSAELNGKINTGKLIIDEGAILNGTCNVAKAGGSVAEAASEAAKPGVNAAKGPKPSSAAS